MKKTILLLFVVVFAGGAVSAQAAPSSLEGTWVFSDWSGSATFLFESNYLAVDIVPMRRGSGQLSFLGTFTQNNGVILFSILFVGDGSGLIPVPPDARDEALMEIEYHLLGGNLIVDFLETSLHLRRRGGRNEP